MRNCQKRKEIAAPLRDRGCPPQSACIPLQILALDGLPLGVEIFRRDSDEDFSAEGSARCWIWFADTGSAVRPFGYVFDPLFLVCCGLYAANRWLIEPHCRVVFFHSWFDDLWLIPCALPPLLLAHRWLGWRNHDEPPTVGEVLAHLIGWSILFEVIGPHIMRTTGDPLDAAAYAFGAGVGLVWWRCGPLHQKPAAGGFDWLAPHYRWMERILAGAKLQRCRLAFLHEIPPPRRALLLGEGHGRFLTELLKTYPKVDCLCVDASAKMLSVARNRLLSEGLDASRVEFVQADLAGWTPPARSFDLVVSQFIFDCFTQEQLQDIIKRLGSVAAPKAAWLIADFRSPPQNGPSRWRAQAILSLMYLFFRWATGIAASHLPDPKALLEQQGFTLQSRRLAEWGLLQTDFWLRHNPSSQSP